DTAFMQFSRKSFLEYVQHYATELHKTDPSFQVASNWAFTSFMPQPVNVDVDFISGDLTPNNSVINAGFEARCIASQALKYNLPWDIMSWAFSMNWDRTSVQSQKSVTQLTQEAAEIIAVGGGFQCYFTQNRDASIRPWQIPVMKGLSDFMRARKAFCRNAKPIPQVAIVYSTFDKYMRSKNVFTNGGLDEIRGITNLLMDAQQSVQVLSEHHLTGNLQQYPLIVIPETEYLDSSFKNELINYVRNGGHLLVIGTNAIPLIAKEAGVELDGEIKKSTTWLGFNHFMTALDGNYQPVILPATAKAIGSIYTKQDLRFPSVPAGAVIPCGKGIIGVVFTDLGLNYTSNQSFLQRDFIQAMVRETFKEPKLIVNGSHLVHVVLNTLNDKTIVHLINAGGEHANRNNYSYDELPALSNITVRLRQSRPGAVMLEPAHKKLKFDYQDGEVIVQVPSVDVHSMLVLQ
ncbi:MAG TPA: hypothetical protein VLC28_05440, partial [Flavitalea sp.]|nr:hypothetical protein [Flavitalea sp.]